MMGSMICPNKLLLYSSKCSNSFQTNTANLITVLHMHINIKINYHLKSTNICSSSIKKKLLANKAIRKYRILITVK